MVNWQSVNSWIIARAITRGLKRGAAQPRRQCTCYSNHGPQQRLGRRGKLAAVVATWE
jgi:hypothetical protein